MLIEGAGLTQEKSLEVFNNTRPKLFDPYSLSAWKAFLAEPESARWRPFGDRLLERAEKVFLPMQKVDLNSAHMHLEQAQRVKSGGNMGHAPAKA